LIQNESILFWFGCFSFVSASSTTTKGWNKVKGHQYSHDFRSRNKRSKKSPQRPNRSNKDEIGGKARHAHQRQHLRAIDVPHRRIGQALYLRQVHGEVQKKRDHHHKPPKGDPQEGAVQALVAPDDRKKVRPPCHEKRHYHPAQGDALVFESFPSRSRRRGAREFALAAGWCRCSR